MKGKKKGRGLSLIKQLWYFTSDNDPGRIENATHNAKPQLTWPF
jgi:hypothetical protein